MTKSHEFASWRLCVLTALVVLLFGATAPRLSAQVNIGSGGFTSTTVCPSTSNPVPPTTCLVATNGTAMPSSGVLQLTGSFGNQTGSAWAVTPQTVVNGFSTSFTFQFFNPSPSPADGIAFLIQNAPNGLAAIGYTGGNGGAIGYGDQDSNLNPQTGQGIPNSLAIELDTYVNSWDKAVPHVAVQTCGTGPNTSHHGYLCSPNGVSSTIGSVTPITENLYDGHSHTFTIQYNPPGTPCTTAPAGAPVAGNLCIYVDQDANQNPVLVVSADISKIGLPNSAAYVGFTAATGGSYETQDVLSWTFAPAPAPPPVVEPVTTGGSTSSVINPTNGNLIEQDLVFPATGLTCNDPKSGGTCPPDLQIVTTNTLIPNLGSYVVGTPFATGQCFGRLGNPNGSCSFFANACFGGSITLASADDYYCPFVKPETGASIDLLDVWDPTSQPDPSQTPGTTISLIAFTPSFPGETWTAAPAGQTTPNAVCTNPDGTSASPPPATILAGGPSGGCDFSDSLVQVYGDQTTSNGKKPKKGWLMGAWGVYMPLSAVSFNGTQANTPGSYTPGATSNLWFKTPPSLLFNVDPACPYPFTYPCGATGPAYNYFSAAPVAAEKYDVILLANQPSANQPPSSYVLQPTPATPAQPNTESAMPVTFTGDLSGITADGTYLLEYGASDNVGIDERYIFLAPASNSTCPVPGGTIPVADSGAKCYVTTPFQIQLNIDSTPPTIPSLTFSANSPYTVGQNVTAYATCADNLSGVASCQGASDANTPTNISSTQGVALVTTLGNHTFTVTATDLAGNATSQTVIYTVAPIADVALFEQPGTATHGTTFHAIFWALDLSTNAASNVTINATLNLPSGVLGGTVSGAAGLVSCTLAGCNTLTTGTTCTVTSNTTVSCSIGTLPSVLKITGAAVKISIPISSSKTIIGSKFTVSGVVTSANDPNSKNNTASQTFTVK